MQQAHSSDSTELPPDLLDECCGLISDIAIWDEAEREGTDPEAVAQQFTALERTVRTFAGSVRTWLRRLRRHHPEEGKDRIAEIESLAFLSKATRPFPLLSLREALEDLKDLEVWLTRSVSGTKTLGKHSTTYRLPKSRSGNLDPNVAKRGAIVTQDSRMTAKQLCKRFDTEEVPLPNDWDEEFAVKKWADAYKNPALRSRIDTIVSKHKSCL